MKRINANAIILWLCAMFLAAACQQDDKSTPSPAASTSTNLDSNAVPGNKPSQTGYAEVNNLKMYYEVHGEGRPIVLLHGSFMTIPLNWKDIIPALSKSRKVIVAEMQGHGRTKDPGRELSYEAMADDVSGLLKHLKIDSADILGYSMGGGVAFQFGIRHPEQLRKLIIVSGVYAHDGWWPEAVAAFPQMSAEMFKGTEIEKQYLAFGNDSASFAGFVKKVISIDNKSYNWFNDVKKIKAPIFMAIGDADGVRYEHALALFRAKGGGKMGDMSGIPESRLAILPGTTHIGIMTDSRDELIGMVNEFIESKQGPPPSEF